MATRSPTRRRLVPVVRETIDTQGYAVLLTEIRVCIQATQHVALRMINKELVGLYWDTGQLIVTRQQTEG